MNDAKTKAIITTTFFAMSGCATIFNGSRDQISVNAPGNAEIRVNGAYVGEGAATTTIPKKGPVTITATKKGCSPHTVQVRRQFDPVTLLGLFIDGGLITILVIDGAATGAWSRATQTHYQLSPRCDAAYLFAESEN